MVIAFVPYGLPAPSYNTIGEQAAIIALSSFGCAVLASAEGRPFSAWLMISAIAWGVATVAYPPLVVALGLLLASLPTIVRPPVREQLAYVGLVVGFQIAVWGCVIGVLTWTRIMESIAYQPSLSPMLNVGQKLLLVAVTLTQNAIFVPMIVVAIIVGLIRSWLHPAVFAVALSALLVGPLFVAPTFFARSHDAIFIAALSGLGMLTWLRRDAPFMHRVLGTLFAVSLAAGVVAAATSTYAFSFPVGGALAGIVAALSGYFYPRQRGWWTLPAAALLGVILWGSASLYYGERPDEAIEPHERITYGPYAGLTASSSTARLLSTARIMLDEWTGADDTIAVVGRLSGLYLLSKARPRVLMPFPMTDLAQPTALIANKTFYSTPANWPTIIISYRDRYFEPINPLGPNFGAGYKEVDQRRTPIGTLSIFHRRD